MKTIIILGVLIPSISFANVGIAFKVFPKSPTEKELEKTVREWTQKTPKAYSPLMTLKACLSDSFVTCVNVNTGQTYWTGGRKYD